MSDPHVREVDYIETDMDGPVIVGVDYDAVSLRVGGKTATLNHVQAEEFAQLFMSAVWQAGQQKARMDAEAVQTGTTNVLPGMDGEEPEIWCAAASVCTNGPLPHVASIRTCRVREPEVAPGRRQGGLT